jgi:hypothetical protein
VELGLRASGSEKTAYPNPVLIALQIPSIRLPIFGRRGTGELRPLMMKRTSSDQRELRLGRAGISKVKNVCFGALGNKPFAVSKD